jgi:hypothetical protein
MLSNANGSLRLREVYVNLLRTLCSEKIVSYNSGEIWAQSVPKKENLRSNFIMKLNELKEYSKTSQTIQ